MYRTDAAARPRARPAVTHLGERGGSEPAPPASEWLLPWWAWPPGPVLRTDLTAVTEALLWSIVSSPSDSALPRSVATALRAVRMLALEMTTVSPPPALMLAYGAPGASGCSASSGGVAKPSVSSDRTLLGTLAARDRLVSIMLFF